MLVAILLGTCFGAAVGLTGNALLFRRLDENRQRSEQPLKGVGYVFFIRYGVDIVALILFQLVVKDGIALVAAALSLTMAVKISLFVVYARKGGRF